MSLDLDGHVPDDLKPVIEFHGHLCPGLIMGYRATKAAMARLQADRSQDEELVVLIENKACGVDAVQYLSGATFGKGNLAFSDNGKHAYTFWRRSDGHGVRVRINVPALDAAGDRKGKAQWLLRAPDEEVLIFGEPREPMPAETVIEESLPCPRCGEYAMRSRLEDRDGSLLCRTCAAAS